MVNRGPTLLAARLDESRYELTGPVVPLVQGVAGDASPGGGRRHYAVSPGGTLAYVAAPTQYSLVVVAPDGTERLIGEGAPVILNPQFSPDGRFIAAAAARTGPPDLWVHDLQTGTASQLTFNGGRAPVWMDDGAGITYSNAGERGGIYTQRIDGRDAPRQLLPLDSFNWLVGWTPDRRTLAYGVMEGAPSSIMALAAGQSRRVVGPGSIWGGRLSEDGRSLAYYSLDSGNFEVFVTPFPDGGTRWLIAEGTDPAWAPDGHEIYYRSGARLMAARLDRASGIRVVSRRVVVEPFLPPFYDDYDIHPDGRTLAMVRPAGSTQGREVSIIVDWVSELRRLLPAQ
jgi:Tol biopolymer transport system component